MMRVWTFFALVCASVVSSSSTELSCTNFTAGQYGGGDASTVSLEMQGKHIKATVLVWAPFSFKSNEFEDGWDGFDIRMFREIARRGGFTYEFNELVKSPNRTWTQALGDTLQENDMTAT